MNSATHEMFALVRIVDLGSFAAAAADIGLTPSALSKLVSRLEDRLDVRLLTRTTRRLALTSEGELYLARSRQVLELVELAESEVTASRAQPRGHLRVNAGAPIAMRLAEQAIPEFLSRYPEISLEVTVTDRLIDPVAENVDIVLRTGPLANSTLVARKLTDLTRIICAAPSYLKKHGEPRQPADLLAHNCFTFTGRPQFNAWPFATPDGVSRLAVSGNFSSDNVAMLVAVACQGHGIVRLANFAVGAMIRQGRLVEILTDAHFREDLPMWAVMPPGRNRAPKVQAFLEFMEGYLRAE